MCVSLNRHSRTKFVPLKYCILPYLEVHIPSKAESSFLDMTIIFGILKSEEKLVPQLVYYLHGSNGDPTAYLEILAKFYQQSLIISKSNHRATSNKSRDQTNDDEPNTWTTVQSSIVNKLNDADLKSFPCKIDKDYEEIFMECVSYTEMYEELVPKSRINSYYDLFHQTSPHTFSVLAKQQSTTKFEMTTPEDLHRKE